MTGDPPLCTCHMGTTTHVGAIGPCPTHTPDPEWDDSDGPMLTRAIDHKEAHMLTGSAFAALLTASALSAGVPPMPGERNPFRVPTKAPKPPPEVQDEIKAAAEDRRDRKRIRNLRNIGHALNCAMDMAIGHQPCSCEKGASNE